ncbi:MAG: hypothetical protein HND52_17280 [Ignavibacteriae bacterium]|nr:hypothetical protein [Ignavibacteriota bacterium]NOG99715.1 hypothetical protein [Ignavibacteriota bacterium]
MTETIAVFIPIIGIIITGLVIVTWVYFRSKEKQMMIEKGMSYEQMVEFLKTKKSPYTMLKIGIVLIFFGFGLGIGLLIEEATMIGQWIPFLIFVFTGAGFVTAFYVADKLDKRDKMNIQ